MVCKKIRVGFIDFFQTKFCLFTVEHDFIAQLLNWLFKKEKPRILPCITVRNFLILGKTYNLYDALLQTFSIRASNVSLLSIVIPRRITLSLSRRSQFCNYIENLPFHIKP